MDEVEREILAVEPNIKSLKAQVPQEFEHYEHREDGGFSYICPRAPNPPHEDPRDRPTAETLHWVDFLVAKREAMKRNRYECFTIRPFQGLGNFVCCCFPLLPQLACSILATW